MIGAASSGAVVVDVLFIVLIVAFFYWRFLTPSGKAANASRLARKAAKDPKPLSQVGDKTGAGLACPKCGGTQFKAGRKTSTKLAFGATSMLGQAHFVRCVTCGTRYRRG